MHVAPGRAAWDMPGRTSLHPELCLDLHTCKTAPVFLKKSFSELEFCLGEAGGLCDMLEV